MRVFHCTHCGKKNALLDDEDSHPVLDPVEQGYSPVPEMHQHIWFQAFKKDGITVYDCACGTRKRVSAGLEGGKEVLDDEAYAEGSVNRALCVH